MTDYTINARDRLVEEIIYSDVQEFVEINDIVLGDVSVSTEHGGNTRISVKIFDNTTEELVNSIAVYIVRDDMNVVLPLFDIPKEALLGYTTTHEILPLLRDTYGVNLLEEDVILEDFATNFSTISAALDSYGWVGTYDFNQLLIMRTQDDWLVQVNGFFLRLTPGTILPGV